MTTLFIILQNGVEQIKKKIETAPDKSYEIGVAIGSLLPFVLFALILYWVFKNVKNRDDF